MRRLLAALALVVAAGSACGDDGRSEGATTGPGGTASTTTSIPPCDEDGRSYALDGVRIHEFCGPARAMVEIGDAALEFTGGTCRADAATFAVHIGVEVIDPEALRRAGEPGFRSFTLLLGRHPHAHDDAPPAAGDGSYTAGVLTFSDPQRTHAVEDKTVTLVGGRMGGTFRGTAFSDEPRSAPTEVSGVFTCNAEVLPLDSVVPSEDTDAEDETGEPSEEEPDPDSAEPDSTDAS